MKKIPIFLVLLCLILPLPAEAAVGDVPYQRDLHTWIQNDEHRQYVEMMLDYHVRTNKAVRKALSGGFSAVFLFDGCSDNMNDPELSDLSYYRVSGICIALRQNEAGEIKMVYINDNASTIPDRPLAYGAWALPEIGEVGPATILDGTYQLYSVYHKGKYEALHVRTSEQDDSLEAIYMTPWGYAPFRATEINIHTRTSNHIITRGMWSAGCPLVGGGDNWEYWKLMEATYHKNYDSFETDNYVGSLTIDRQALRTEMYTLYRNPDAVDVMLANTLSIQPKTYFALCSQPEEYPELRSLEVLRETQLMTLPCSNGSDARSLPLTTLRKGESVQISGSLYNTMGNLWYQTEWNGQSCYLYSGHMEQPSWLDKLMKLEG